MEGVTIVVRDALGIHPLTLHTAGFAFCSGCEIGFPVKVQTGPHCPNELYRRFYPWGP